MPQGSIIRDTDSGREYIIGDYIGRGQLGVVYGLLESDQKTPVADWVVKEPLGQLAAADRERFDLEIKVLKAIGQAAKQRAYLNPVAEAHRGMRASAAGAEETVVLLEKADADDWRLERQFTAGDFTRDNTIQLAAAHQYTHLLEIVHETVDEGADYFCRDRTVQDLLWQPAPRRLMVLDWNVVEKIADKPTAWAADLQRFGVLWYASLVGESFIAGQYPPQPQSEDGQRRWTSEISAGMKGIILRCLEPNAAHRYAGVSDLRSALEYQMGLLDETNYAELLKLGQGLEAQLAPEAEPGPDRPLVDKRELERRVLAAFDMARRRGVPQAQDEFTRFENLVQESWQKYLKKALPKARQGDWPFALQQINDALRDSETQPEITLNLHRWRLGFELGRAALANTAKRREAQGQLLDGKNLIDLERALDAMYDGQWDEARQHLGRVVEVLAWLPEANQTLADLSREIDLRRAWASISAESLAGNYRAAAEAAQKADEQLKTISDAGYSGELMTVLPPFAEEARRFANLAAASHAVAALPELVLNSWADLEVARSSYEGQRLTLEQHYPGSAASYRHTLQAHFAPALDTLRAVELLRDGAFEPADRGAFSQIRRAIDLHSAKYPFIASILIQGAQASLSQPENPASSGEVERAQRRARVAQQAFAGDGRSVAPATVSMKQWVDGKLQKLEQVAGALAGARHQVETQLDAGAVGPALATLEQIERDHLEPFTYDGAGPSVATLKSALTSVLNTQHLAQAAAKKLDELNGQSSAAKLLESELNSVKVRTAAQNAEIAKAVEESQAELKRLALSEQAAKDTRARVMVAANDAAFLQQLPELTQKFRSALNWADLAELSRLNVDGLSLDDTDAMLKGMIAGSGQLTAEDPVYRNFSKLYGALAALRRLAPYQQKTLDRCAQSLRRVPPQRLDGDDLNGLKSLSNAYPDLLAAKFMLQVHADYFLLDAPRPAPAPHPAPPVVPALVPLPVNLDFKELEDHHRQFQQLLRKQNLPVLRQKLDTLVQSSPYEKAFLGLLLSEVWRPILQAAEGMRATLKPETPDLDALADCLRLPEPAFRPWHDDWQNKFTKRFRQQFSTLPKADEGGRLTNSGKWDPKFLNNYLIEGEARKRSGERWLSEQFTLRPPDRTAVPPPRLTTKSVTADDPFATVLSQGQTSDIEAYAQTLPPPSSLYARLAPSASPVGRSWLPYGVAGSLVLGLLALAVAASGLSLSGLLRSRATRTPIPTAATQVATRSPATAPAASAIPATLAPTAAPITEAPTVAPTIPPATEAVPAFLAITSDLTNIIGVDNALSITQVLSRSNPAVDGQVVQVAWAPDGGTLGAVGVSGDTGFLWLAQSELTQTAVFTISAAASSLSFSPDGQTVVMASTGYVYFHSATASIAELLSPQGNLGVLQVRYRPGAAEGSSRLLAILRSDNQVYLDNLSDPAKQLILPVGRSPVATLEFSVDGRWLVAANPESISLWDVDNLLATRMLTPTMILDQYAPASALAISHDGMLLAAGHDDGNIDLWDLVNGKAAGTLHAGEAAIQSLAFSPDSRLLASAHSDGAIILWEPKDGTSPLMTLTGDSGAVTSLAFSPHGTSLASGTQDGAVQLWAVP